MSKTKKYKYFRKNRRGKNGKNSKHKTRRVQRGGNGNETHPTASLHSSGSHPPPPPPPPGKSAAAAAATQASNQLHTQHQPTHQPPDIEVGLNPLAHTGSNKGTPAEPLAEPLGGTPGAQNPKAEPVSAVAQQAQPADKSSLPPQPEAVVSIGASSGAAQQPYGNSDGQPNVMGNGLGYQPTGYEPSAVSNANQVPSGSSVPNISDSKPRLTSFTPDELKRMSDEEKIAYLSRNAIARNEAREQPDARIALLAKTIPDAILGRLASIGSESQENLVKEETLVQFTNNFGEMMKDSEKVKELVREYNRLLFEEINEIYREIEHNGEITEDNQKDINNLQSIVKSNIAFINQVVIEPSLLRHALLTGSLAAAGSQYATPDPSPPSSKSDKPGFFKRMGEKLRNFGNSISRKNKNNNYQQLADESGDKNKEPGFFKRMFSRKNNKVATGPSAGTPAETPEGTPAETPEGTPAGETQAEETPEARHIRERNEQDALLLKQRAKRVQNGLIPTFKRGVTEKYDSAKNAVKRGFTDLKQKFSKDTTGETQPLLGNTAAQKKTWRERLTIDNMKKSASKRVESLRTTAKNVKEAATSAMNRITRKNKGSTNPEEKRGLLSDEGIEMTEQPQQPQQPEAKAPEPRVPPPVIPRIPNSSASSQATEPSSDSKLSQQSTVDLSDQNKGPDTIELQPKISTQPPAPRVPPPVSPRQRTLPPPTSPNDWYDDGRPVKTNLKVVINDINDNSRLSKSYTPPLLAPPPGAARQIETRRAAQAAQAAGGKTRKNRQYIHEIKENRTHLFNKEMQILNSIRNFKNGQHHGPNERGKNKPENIQKKFIKVIKRS